MRWLALTFALLAIADRPSGQRTLYVSPDVPTNDPGGSGAGLLAWDVVAYKAGIYTPVLSFPPQTAVDALHKMDRPDSGSSPSRLPPSCLPAAGSGSSPRT